MKWRIAFCTVSILIGAAGAAGAAGLSTTFFNVSVDHAPLGKSIEAHGPEGKGFRIKNLGELPVHVHMQALIPQNSQLRPGATPIPDASWISFDPPVLNILPGKEGETKVHVKIPDLLMYRDHFYQVMIWCRGETVHTDGMTLNAALLTKLLIHTMP